MAGPRAVLAATSLSRHGYFGYLCHLQGMELHVLMRQPICMGCCPSVPARRECSVPGTCSPLWAFYTDGLWEALVPPRSVASGVPACSSGLQVGRWVSPLRPRGRRDSGQSGALGRLGPVPLNPDAQLGPSPHSEAGGHILVRCKRCCLWATTKGRAFRRQE